MLKDWIFYFMLRVSPQTALQVSELWLFQLTCCFKFFVSFLCPEKCFNAWGRQWPGPKYNYLNISCFENLWVCQTFWRQLGLNKKDSKKDMLQICDFLRSNKYYIFYCLCFKMSEKKWMNFDLNIFLMLVLLFWLGFNLHFFCLFSDNPFLAFQPLQLVVWDVVQHQLWKKWTFLQ